MNVFFSLELTIIFIPSEESIHLLHLYQHIKHQLIIIVFYLKTIKDIPSDFSLNLNF